MADEKEENLKKALKEKGYTKKASEEIAKWYE
jgi:predicted Ser/Thr protein kinase